MYYLSYAIKELLPSKVPFSYKKICCSEWPSRGKQAKMVEHSLAVQQSRSQLNTSPALRVWQFIAFITKDWVVKCFLCARLLLWTGIIAAHKTRSWEQKWHRSLCRGTCKGWCSLPDSALPPWARAAGSTDAQMGFRPWTKTVVFNQVVPAVQLDRSGGRFPVPSISAEDNLAPVWSQICPASS